MTITKLSTEQAMRYAEHEQHALRKLRTEEVTTRNAEKLGRYTEFARLSIICARRGYMLNA